MYRSSLRRLLALVFAFALIAAACGDSDDSDGDAVEADAGDTDGTEPEAAAEEDDEGGTGGQIDEDALEESTDGEEEEEEMDESFDTSSLDGVIARADAERQGVVDMLTAGIEAGDYGIGDDNVLRGPGGLEIDLNECPENWSDTEGLSDTQIKYGQSFVRSGQLAAYGAMTDGFQVFFDSQQIGDRSINFITKDDGYVAAQTIEFVDELIEADKVFAVHTGGSPNTLAVYDKLNNECIPHISVATGHPAWGDPVVHPWTTGLILSYSTEALLWGTWIRDNLADHLPVKVAGLVMDNDFGLAYEIGFEDWAEENPDIVSEFVPVRHDPAAPTITNEVTTAKAADPDVFISMTAGNACLLAIQEVERAGLNDTLLARFTPSVCKGIPAYMIPAGEAADGWYIVGGGVKDSTDPQYADEPFIAWMNDQFVEAGHDPSISQLANGVLHAYPIVEALKIADALPGGLTRSNTILAAHSLNFTHPLYLDGVTIAMNGVEDAYLVEGSDFSQYSADTESWNQVGAIVDANGNSPNCVWDKDNGGCA